MIQTIGRAARNENGKVLMYADRITDSMKVAIDETNRRRAKQIEYNVAHGIVPKTVLKSKEEILEQTSVADMIGKGSKKNYYVEPTEVNIAADPIVAYMSKEEIQKQINKVQKEMEKAARELNFMDAARLRDEMLALQKLI
jgi:excinuclease ABC subunit B